MNWLTALFGQSSSKHTRSAKSGTGRRKTRTLRFEQCETRQLMTASPLTMAPTLIQETAPALVAPALTAPQATVAQVGPTATVASAGDVTVQQAATRKIDLDVTVTSGAVTPTLAKDLNLLHFYGGEQLTIPTVVKNYGPGTANGSATVSVYLSTTNNLNGAPVLLGQKTVNINLGNNAKQTVAVDVTVPTTLATGQEYFIVAKVTTPLVQSTINDVRASDRKFEFVGTPANAAPFTPNAQGKVLYFDFIRDTLKGRSALLEQNPLARQNDAQSFIGSFQTDATYPYLQNGVPMIGLAINLNTLDSYMEHIVASFVTAYYQANYGQWLAGSDASIINMLKTQAYAGGKTPVISSQQSGTLFDLTYPGRQQPAKDALGEAIFSQLNPLARIAVMDMVYAIGVVQQNMVAPLKALDYVQAGFRLVDSPRTLAGTLRVKAEYQNLLTSTRTSLGKLI
ncbi:MAG: hypothetical protein K2Y37_15300 [Pirellulales bacterium]|nr:hypothetical protein [Pirellulales bacterium]